MRVRFVDRNGQSFFDEVDDQLRHVWLRFVPFDPSFSLTEVANLHVEREVYRREWWYLPIGPYASPVDLGGGEIVDVVYRFDGSD